MKIFISSGFAMRAFMPFLIAAAFLPRTTAAAFDLIFCKYAQMLAFAAIIADYDLIRG